MNLRHTADFIASKIRGWITNNFAGYKIESVEDLNQSKELKTTGIRLRYSGEIRVIIRPSGTEPKLKCYIEVVKSNKSESLELISQIKEVLTKVLS